MRDYEIVYIFDSTLEEEEIESKLDSYHERITDDGSGEITAVEDWGKRQLAYPIENHENGHYVVAHFTVEPAALEEFERRLNLDGDLLRHLVVLHEGELPTPPSARRPGDGTEDDEEPEGTEEEDEESQGAEEGAEGDDGSEEEAEESEGDEEEAEDGGSDETSEEEPPSDERTDDEDGDEPPEEEPSGSGETGEGADEDAGDEGSDDEEEKE